MAGENDNAAAGESGKKPAEPQLGFATPRFGGPLDNPEAVNLPGRSLLGIFTAPLSPLATVCAVGTFFVLAANFMVPTMGARRSVRLKWQERKDRARAEVEARVGESEEVKGRKP